MKIAECELQSISSYSQSRYNIEPKKEGETDAAWEERTWRVRCHSDDDGWVFIPPMAFANNIKTAAAYLGLKVPGKGSSLYTKHFLSGVLVPEPLELGIHKDNVQGEWLHVDSKGRKGGSSRVWRCYPYIPEWSGKAIYYILDDIIDEQVFTKVLNYGGNVIGIGRFRPERGGFKGRFKVKSVTWAEG